MSFQTFQAWLDANKGATDAEIAAAMDKNGVTTKELADQFGYPIDQVQARYDAAIAPAPAPAPTTTQLGADGYLPLNSTIPASADTPTTPLPPAPEPEETLPTGLDVNWQGLTPAPAPTATTSSYTMPPAPSGPATPEDLNAFALAQSQYYANAPAYVPSQYDPATPPGWWSPYQMVAPSNYDAWAASSDNYQNAYANAPMYSAGTLIPPPATPAATSSGGTASVTAAPSPAYASAPVPSVFPAAPSPSSTSPSSSSASFTAPTMGANYMPGGMGATSGPTYYNQYAAPTMAPSGPAPTLQQSYAGAQNPYLAGIAQSIGTQTQQALDQSLNGIQSNSIGVGGLGGSRQGVAQGIAIGQANSGLAGALANMYGQDWAQAQNRDLAKYQSDLQGYYTGRGQDYSNYANEMQNALGLSAQGLQKYGYDLQNSLGLSGQALQKYLGDLSSSTQKYGYDQNYALGQGNLGLNSQIAENNFYAGQRNTDLNQAMTGAQIYNMGVQGGWIPLNNASNIFNDYTGLSNTTETGTKGGGLLGALGGAGAATQWWNGFNKPTTTTSPYDYTGQYWY